MIGRCSVNFRQQSAWLGDLPSTSVNFLCCWETFHQLPLTFHAAGRPSINFRPVWVWLGDILSTSIYIPCGWEIFCHLSVRPVDLLSTFRTVCRYSVYFRQLSVRLEGLLLTFDDFPYGWKTFWQLPQTFHKTFRQLPSTFHKAWRPSVRPNFCQLLPTFHVAGRPSIAFRNFFVTPSDLPSTPVNFPCCRETFRKLPSASLLPGELLSTSVDSLYCRETFHNYFMQTEHLPSTFRAVCKHSVNLIYFPCGRETFFQLPSTLCAAGKPSVNFPQHSFWSDDLLCTSVNFIYSRENFCQILCNFPANRRHSLHFCLLSLRSGELPLITEGLLATWKLHGR